MRKQKIVNAIMWGLSGLALLLVIFPAVDIIVDILLKSAGGWSLKLFTTTTSGEAGGLLNAWTGTLLLMFLLLLLAAPGAEQHGPVALAAVPRRPDQPQQPRRSGRLVEREVECGVRAHRRPHVRAAPGGVELPEAAARRLLVGGAEQLGCAPQREGLEREPHREELPQLLDVERHHLRPVVRDVLRESQCLELAHRLADRGDAHPERACDILQPEGRSRRQISMNDRFAEPFERSFGHRAVADGGAVTSECRLHEERA